MKISKEYLKSIIIEALQEISKEDESVEEKITKLKSQIELKKSEIADLEKQVRKLHASKRKPSGPIPRDADGNMLTKRGNLRRGAPGSKQRDAYDTDFNKRRDAGEYDFLNPIIGKLLGDEYK